MAKRPVKRVARKTSASKPKGPAFRPCSQQPCKRISAYMRTEDGEKVTYCAHHWNTIVEPERQEYAREVVARFKEDEAERIKNGVHRRKSPAKKTTARRVVRKKK